MKTIANLLWLAVLYTCIVAISVAASCLLSLYKCELIGGESTFKEWLIPGVIVFSALVFAGVGVVYLIVLVTSSRQGLLGQPVIQFMLGSLLGVLPLLFFHAITKSLSFSYRPSLQEVPFLLGGLAVVSLIKLKQILQHRRRSKGTSKLV